MSKMILFTDGSVHAQLKVGYGAYLAVTESVVSIESLKNSIKLKRFKNTSSTKLELQTLIWALKDIEIIGSRVIVYTDSQNTIGLLGRRERLEQNNYMTRKNRYINNHELYKEFYKTTDQLDCEFIKVRGHKKSHQKDEIDRLFALVDTASRRALRDTLTKQC